MDCEWIDGKLLQGKFRQVEKGNKTREWPRSTTFGQGCSAFVVGGK